MQLAEGFQQPVQVLLVRDEVVACVVDHPDVGIGAGLAVVEELLAGIFQHLDDAAGGAELVHEVLARRQPRGRGLARLRHPAAAIVPGKAHAFAGLADLADERGKVDDRVVGQFAVMGALQRPGAAELGARFGEKLGHLADLVGRNAGDARGPVGRLGGAVILALDIGDPAVGAGRVLVHVGAVFQTLFQHVMGHAQEQRDVRVGHDLHPVRIQVGIRRRALRVDRDEAAARVADLGPGAGHAVVGHGELDPVVLDRVAADEDEDLGVVAHDLPCGLGRIDLHVADDVRQGHLRRAGREVALGDGAAADQVEEALLHDVRAERAGI